jgi:RNase P subunit RPR2
MRGHLAEFGLIEAQGLHRVAKLIAIILEEKDRRISDIARQVLKMIVSQIEDTQTRIYRTAQKGRTHDCKRPLLITQKILASRGPSTHEAALLTTCPAPLAGQGRKAVMGC